MALVHLGTSFLELTDNAIDPCSLLLKQSTTRHCVIFLRNFEQFSLKHLSTWTSFNLEVETPCSLADWRKRCRTSTLRVFGQKSHSRFNNNGKGNLIVLNTRMFFYSPTTEYMYWCCYILFLHCCQHLCLIPWLFGIGHCMVWLFGL